MFMKISRRGLAGLTAAGLLSVMLALSVAQAHVGDAPEEALDLARMSRRAELVFTGEVVGVQYANSDIVPELLADGSPALDAGGAPILVDGSDLPHTFVTYRVEKVFKGRVEGRSVTLRFLGGVNDLPRSQSEIAPESPADEVFGVSETPLFDTGDRDLLFVRGNTTAICPLVNCSAGRFRLIPKAADRRFVYTDRGEELRKVGQRLIIGPPQQLEAILSNRIGPFTIRTQYDEGRDSDVLAGLPMPNIVIGTHLSQNVFEAAVATAVRRAQTQNDRPIPDADPESPFTAGALRETSAQEPEPTVASPRRAWLENLAPAARAALEEAERQEQAAFEAGDGNPVVPLGAPAAVPSGEEGR